MAGSNNLEESFQRVDYMSILSDSIDIVENDIIKNENIDEDSDGHKGRLLNVTEKMHCFNRLVFERSMSLQDMCTQCLSDFIRVSHHSQKKFESQAQSYEENIIALEHEKRKSVADENKVTVADSLINEIKDLQSEYDRLCQEEQKHDDQLQRLLLKGRDANEQITEMMKNINVLHYELNESDSMLQDSVTLSVSAEQEVQLLSSPHFIPLFKFEILALPSNLAVNIVPGRISQRNIVDHGRVVLAINGFRASFSPLAEYNLNWAEINAAWSNICTAFICYQQLLDMTTMLGNVEDQLHSESEGILPLPGEDTLYSYNIVCFRHSGILVESPRRRKNKAKSSSHQERCNSYCLSYNANSSISWCADVRGSSDEYFKAMVALAIVVIEVAVVNCRLDIITSFPKLNYLYTHAKPHKIYRERHDVHVDVLKWPSLERIISLSEMKSELNYVDTTNDVLLAIYSMINFPASISMNPVNND